MKLSAFKLKLIAIVCMTANHALVYTFSGYLPFIFKAVGLFLGGFTFPIMAFLLTEGFKYTHDKRKYGKRLLMWAVISQIPFTLFTGHLLYVNVITTLFCGFIALVLMEKIHIERKKRLICFSLIILIICSTILFDWALIGVVTVLAFHLSKRKIGVFITCLLPTIYQLLTMGVTINLIYATGCIISALLIFAYNGTLGSPKPLQNKIGKSLFYIYYPLHLLILALIKIYFSM